MVVLSSELARYRTRALQHNVKNVWIYKCTLYSRAVRWSQRNFAFQCLILLLFRTILNSKLVNWEPLLELMTSGLSYDKNVYEAMAWILFWWCLCYSWGCAVLEMYVRNQAGIKNAGGDVCTSTLMVTLASWCSINTYRRALIQRNATLRFFNEWTLKMTRFALCRW